MLLSVLPIYDLTALADDELTTGSCGDNVTYSFDSSTGTLTISGSGALSTAETTMEGRAAIFIPSPNVTADHQYYNAKAVADAGGAFIVREDENTVRDVMRIIRSLDSDRDQIKQMEAASRSVAPVDAADIICDTIMETYRK